MVKKLFDLIALGTGSAAATVAHKCRTAGWSVAIVDKRPFGGTCALRGCDPKKVLVGAAELVDRRRRMDGKGVEGRFDLDWQALMRFKRSFTEPTPKNRERDFEEAGIVMFHGRARFVGPNDVELGDEKLSARHVVIATGAMPAPLGVAGEEYLATSTDFLELVELPTRIVFAGGGFISFEFAHIAARAGAKTTILHRGPRALVGFDADMVDHVVEATRARGIDVRLDTRLQSIEKTSRGFLVRAEQNGVESTLEADLVVHGAGRVPEVEDLDLERANVKREKRGISVNEYLQSVSNPAVYAAGDVAAVERPMLTPVAALEGHAVASNLLKGNKRKPDYTGVASVVFTIPPLAMVGIQERQAKERGLAFRVHQEKTSSWYSTRRVGEEMSAFKVLIDDEHDRILGASLIGPEAEEVINLFAMAIRAGFPASELKQMPFAYPSIGSDVPYML